MKTTPSLTRFEKISRFCWISFILFGATPAMVCLACGTGILYLAIKFDISDSPTERIQAAVTTGVFLSFSVAWFAGVLYGHFCNQWQKRWIPFIIELFPTGTLLLWAFSAAKLELHQPIVAAGVLYLGTMAALLVFGAFAATRKS